MTTYIVLLRGINAGRIRKIKMDKLREICAQIGFPSAVTYIQTGNIIIQAEEMQDRSQLIKKLQALMERELGWSVPTLIYSLEEWESVVIANPFLDKPDYDPAFFQVALLQQKTDSPMKQFEFDNIRHAQGERAVYSYCPDGYSNAKYTNNDIERKLNVFATTRNWNTMKKLLELARYYSQ